MQNLKNKQRYRFNATLLETYTKNHQYYILVGHPTEVSSNQIVRDHCHIAITKHYYNICKTQKINTTISFTGVVYPYYKIRHLANVQRKQYSIKDIQKLTINNQTYSNQNSQQKRRKENGYKIPYRNSKRR